MELDLFVTPGLGDNSYLLTWGDEAAVIDPQRDVERFVHAAGARGARIRYAIETHIHNDYVSGAAELRAAGAEVVGPADAGYGFPYRGLRDEDELRIGDATLVALATPGHTPEHTAYLLRGSDGSPAGLFSGGSLIVGSAGRTDLLGMDRAEELARLQFRTMRRLAALPGQVALLPTHGAGSFCASSPPGGERTSTLGDERAANPALADDEQDAFVRRQLSGLQAFPSYYAHMAPINRVGPPVTGGVPTPPALSPDEVASELERGTWLVDGRAGQDFAQAHVPGSLNIPLEPSFAAYVGWLLPFDTPVVLSVEGEGALEEAATQLHRIGWSSVRGHLDGGLDAWIASGRQRRSYPTIDIAELVADVRRGRARDVVDVRQRTEWDAGHLEGSRHLFVGDLPSALDTFGRHEPATIVCATGYRSSMAASLLDRAGVPVRLVASSGVTRALALLRASA